MARLGETAVVQFFADSNANTNPEARTYDILPPLREAARSCHPDIVHLLLRNGADMKQHGGFCGYVFHAAVAGCGTRHMFNAPLEAGADVNA